MMTEAEFAALREGTVVYRAGCYPAPLTVIGDVVRRVGKPSEDSEARVEAGLAVKYTDQRYLQARDVYLTREAAHQVYIEAIRRELALLTSHRPE